MLDEKFLQRLDALSLHMRHPTSGGAGGLRRSKALGSSVEFSDFREYAEGDDIRRLDWNAYARFDKLFLKLFMEEQETHVHLIVDASASMGFGEPSKWETAVKLTEVLCYLALNGNDQVTVYAVQGGGHTHTRPLSGRQGFVAASGFLGKIVPKGTTDLATAVQRLPIPQGKGVAVLLSDFLSPGGYDTALKSLRYRKQEVTSLQVLSQRELEPVFEDAVQLKDSETGEVMEILASYDTLREYRQAALRFLDELKRFCHQGSMGYALMRTEADVEQTLLRELTRVGLLA